MKIVVTGALGHIGSRFVQTLVTDFPQAELVLIDHLQTKRDSALVDLPADRFRLEIADVLTAPLERLFRDAAVVVHLAAVTDAHSRAATRSRMALDVDVTGRVARACATVGAPMFFPSTTSVYGSRASVVDESCEELVPQTVYAETKLASERLLAAVARESDLEFVICRFGSIFGVSPGMRFRTAVNRFLWQACSGQPLTVWRTAPGQRRPYLDVEDCVRAISFILSKRLFARSVYNLATATFTVSEIVDVIRRHLPDLRVDIEDNEAMNDLSYGVSCRRIESLGFEFQGSLERAVRETVAHLRAANTSR